MVYTDYFYFHMLNDRCEFFQIQPDFGGLFLWKRGLVVYCLQIYSWGLWLVSIPGSPQDYYGFTESFLWLNTLIA